MSIPRTIKRWINEPKFWKSYYWIFDGDQEFPQFADFKLPLPLSEKYGLSLRFDKWLSYTGLDFVEDKQGIEIGWDDQAHWHPHVLRWDELEKICRVVALRDSEWVHPGPLLLLLYRFAPICEGDDIEWIAMLLASAMRRLIDSEDPDIYSMIERNDAQKEGFFWTQTNEDNWLIDQSDQASNRGLYSMRTDPSLKGFPHKSWAEMMQAVDQQLISLSTLDPKLATLFADEGDEASIKDLATQVERDHPELAKAISNANDLGPACWVAESILQLPIGTLLKQWVAFDYSPRMIQNYELTLVVYEQGKPYFGSRTYFDRCSIANALKVLGGFAEASGSLSSEGRTLEDQVYVQFIGNAEQGIERIRESMRWAKCSTKSTLQTSRGSENYELDILSTAPAKEHVLELGRLKIERWDEGEYRIDRANIPLGIQKKIASVLKQHLSQPTDEDGWHLVKAKESSLKLWAPELGVKKKLPMILVRFAEPTKEICEILVELMEAAELFLLPMALVTNEKLANSLSVEYPTPRIVTAEGLFEILRDGSLAWLKSE